MFASWWIVLIGTARPSVWEGEAWSYDLTPSPRPLGPEWTSRLCAWCPFARREGRGVVRQNIEESGECVYEPDLDACMHGGVECLADVEGKEACVWTRSTREAVPS